MAFTRNWDESAPLGSVNAATLDTIIQQLKTDLRERLVDVLPDWSDDAVDPKRIVIFTGATRPSDPNAGELFLDTDTNVFEIYNGSAWIRLNAVALVGTLDNRPAASSVPDGSLYLATDDNTLYVESSDAWVSTKAESSSHLLIYKQGSINITTAAGGSTTVDVSSSFVDPITEDNFIVLWARMRFRESSVPGTFSPWIYMNYFADQSMEGDGGLYEDIEGVSSTIFPIHAYLRSQSVANGANGLEFTLFFGIDELADTEDIDYQVQLLVTNTATEVTSDPTFVE